MNLRPEHTHNGVQVRTVGMTTYIGRTPGEIMAAKRDSEASRQETICHEGRLYCRACRVALPYVKTAWGSVPGDCETLGCMHNHKETQPWPK